MSGARFSFQDQAVCYAMCKGCWLVCKLRDTISSLLCIKLLLQWCTRCCKTAIHTSKCFVKALARVWVLVLPSCSMLVSAASTIGSRGLPARGLTLDKDDIIQGQLSCCTIQMAHNRQQVRET